MIKAVSVILLLSASAGSQDKPVELGKVAWRRGFDAAASAAEKEGRLLLVLFQEVPG